MSSYQRMLIAMARMAGAVYIEMRMKPISTPYSPIHVNAIWTAKIGNLDKFLSSHNDADKR